MAFAWSISPQHLVQGLGCDRRIAAETLEVLALALQLLHQVGLEIRAAGDVEDVEQREDRDMMFRRVGPGREVLDLVVEILEPEQSPDPFVQRKFVADHNVRPRPGMTRRSIGQMGP